jgi:hypothetical protein
MVGTVTISLADFESLRKQADSGGKITEEIVKAAKELEVFLSFLVTRENIDEHIEEFNSYSKRCKIKIIEGRAKIQIISDEESTSNTKSEYQDGYDSEVSTDI